MRSPTSSCNGASCTSTLEFVAQSARITAGLNPGLCPATNANGRAQFLGPRVALGVLKYKLSQDGVIVRTVLARQEVIDAAYPQ